MYVKFTRLDGSPIWLNSAFVITIEPRRQGGSTVVPIGDGLDYDVRETPDQVLAALANAPVPAVVPVPAPKGLTKTPEDVSPEPESREPERYEVVRRDSAPASKPVQASVPSASPNSETTAEQSVAPVAEKASEDAEPVKPVRKTTRSRTRKTTEGDGEAKPRKTTRRTKKSTEDEVTAEQPAGAVAEASAEVAAAEPAPDAEPAQPAAEASLADVTEPTAEPAVVEPPAPASVPREPYAFPLSEDQLVRLRKLAPRSVRKLKNTLYSQFRILDTDSLIAELVARSELTVDQQRINWMMPF